MTLLLALGILMIAGLGVFALIRPRQSIDTFEVVGASIFLGSIFISAALFALGPILQGRVLAGCVASMALLLGASGVLRLRNAEWETLPASRAFALILLPAILFVAWQAFVRPLGYDGVFNFEVRARLAWENGGGIPREFFSDPSRATMHAEYPLFVPLNQLWVYLCAGEPHQGLVKALGVAWFTAAACLTFSQLSRVTRHPAPAFIALALMVVVPMVVLYPGGAIWVWGDFPIGAWPLPPCFISLSTGQAGRASFASS